MVKLMISKTKKFFTGTLIKAVEISFLVYIFIYLFCDQIDKKYISYIIVAFIALVTFIWNAIKHFEEKEQERSEHLMKEYDWFLDKALKNLDHKICDAFNENLRKRQQILVLIVMVIMKGIKKFI